MKRVVLADVRSLVLKEQRTPMVATALMQKVA
jgi:hypothetical protein